MGGGTAMWRLKWEWGGLGWNGVVELELGQGGDWSPADGKAIKMAPRCG